MQQNQVVLFPRVQHNLNTDKIFLQTFSSFPAPPRPPLPGTILPDTQLVQEEDVQHNLNTDLSGSSENVDDRCVCHVCQLSEEVQQLYTQADIHGGFGGSVETIDESDISEITTSESEWSPYSPDCMVNSSDECLL